MRFSTPAPQISGVAAEPCAGPEVPSVCFFNAHVYVCEFEGGAIILDLRNDTYLGIDARYLLDLRAQIGNWPESGRIVREVGSAAISRSESLISDLLARGILTTSAPSKKLSSPTIPTMALTVAGAVGARRRIPLTHVAQFFIALLMVVCLSRSGLLSLLEWLRRRQSSIHPGNTATRRNPVEQLASFLWLRTWCYTARRRCLFDSLVLSVYLTRGMVPCTMVIGVATKPFLAHAWVQIGSSVLNDTAEHVQTFKPIFSVGGD